MRSLKCTAAPPDIVCSRRRPMILRLRADDDGIFPGPDEVAHRFIGLIRYVDREDSSPNSRRIASFITEAIDAT